MHHLPNDMFNKVGLEDDIKALMLAQYFMTLFNTRADHYGVIIPKMRFNSDGAFIGQLVEDINTSGPSYGSHDTRSMLFNYFLATKLLDFSGQHEIRFTDVHGEGRVEAEVKDIDEVIAAFTHSTLVHSHGTMVITDIQGIYENGEDLVFYDPQAHSSRNTSGKDTIEKFIHQHECNAYCRKMQLDEKVAQSVTTPPLSPKRHPLRIGFSPLKEL